MIDISDIVMLSIFCILLIVLIVHIYKNRDAYTQTPKHTGGLAVLEALRKQRIAFEKLIAEKKENAKKCPICFPKTLKINDCEGPPNCTRSMQLYDKAVAEKR